MEFRNFGKLDWKVSALGFGAMRLPTAKGAPPRGNQVDEAETSRMIRRAIDQGVNYVDTAYGYHGGNSEIAVGKALQGGYREKVKLATKSPVWMIHSEADFDRLLNEQLQKLQTDHIDCYLLHGLDEKRWRDSVLKFNLLEKAYRALRDGRICNLGFSFHDNYESFTTILNACDWTFCQIQYNYMDTEHQAGTKGLKLAAAKGLAVVIMEPLLGGRLANPPASIREIIDQSLIRRSAVDWSLQWLWDQPEVSVVLSGMSTMAQVEANLESASRSRVHSYQAADFEIIERLRRKYRERTVIPCNDCGYCMPCPNGVNIPRNFKLYNDAHLHEDIPGASFTYQKFTPEPERASACIACHTCEELCPQKVPVSEWMPKVDALLGPAKP